MIVGSLYDQKQQAKQSGSSGSSVVQPLIKDSAPILQKKVSETSVTATESKKVSPVKNFIASLKLDQVSLKKAGESFIAGAKMIPSQLKQGSGVIIQAIVSQQKTLDNFYQKAPKPVQDALGNTPIFQSSKLRATFPKVTEKVNKKVEDVALNLRESGFQESKQKKDEYAKTYQPSEGLQKYLEMVSFNLPQLATSVALTTGTALLTKNPALATTVGLSTSYGMGASEVYDEARSNGLSDKESLPLAQFGGVIIGAIDFIPLGRLLRKTGASKVVEKSIIKKISKALVSLGVQAGFEGITEGTQEIVGNAISSTYNENQDLFEGVKESVIVGTLLGGMSDLTIEAVTGMTGKSAENIQTKISKAIETPKEDRTEEQKEIVKTLFAQEMTSDQLINYVTENKLQDTEEGRSLVKTAYQAQQTGQNVKLSLSEDEKSLDAELVSKQYVAPVKKEAVTETPVVENKKEEVEIPKEVLFEGNKYQVKGVRGTSGDKYLVENKELGEIFTIEKSKVTLLETKSEKPTVEKNFDESINKKAISEYGTTQVPESAGFITPEGKIIDSSGKKQGSNSEGRNIDHREIAVFAIPEDETTSGMSNSDALSYFMVKSGSIRVSVMPEEINIDVITKPSDKQLKSLKKIAGDKSVVADISKENGQVAKSGTFKTFDEYQSWIENEFSSTEEVKTEEKTVVETPKVLKELSKKKIENAKTIRDVTRLVKKIRSEFDQLITEAEGKAEFAKEQREGLNTKKIADLRKIYKRTRSFQEGDIETIRASKHQKLLDSVLENVWEKYPDKSEQEAFDFAMELPTKAEEKVLKPEEMKILKEKEKKLSLYLETLKQKQESLNLEESDALTEEWRRVLASQEKLSKIIEVPRKQLPVGEGEKKVSRLEARVNKFVEKVTEEQIERLGLASYNQLSKKENIEKAVAYVSANPEEAMQVLAGQREAPQGILHNAIYIAMEQLAQGDLNLARRLASLSSTRMGQEISILTEVDPDSTVRLMRDIISVREEVFKRKFNGKTATEAKAKVVSEIQAQIKKPDKVQWNEFLNEIKC